MRLSTALLAALVLATLAGAIGFVRHRQKKSLEAMEHNEWLASEALSLIADVERAFKDQDADENGIEDYWTGDVAGLLRFGDLYPSIEKADAAPLHPVPRTAASYFGYWFLAVEGLEGDPRFFKQDTDGKSGRVHHRTRFAFCAYPSEYGRTGRYTYLRTEHDILMSTDNGGRPILQFSKEMEKYLGMMSPK